MHTQEDTIRLLNQLLEAIEEMNRMWDEFEAATAAHFERPMQEAA